MGIYSIAAALGAGLVECGWEYERDSFCYTIDKGEPTYNCITAETLEAIPSFEAARTLLPRAVVDYAETVYNTRSASSDSTLDDFADDVYQVACEKGWHDDDDGEDAFVERSCNNLHDEVSELHEAWRNGRLRQQCDKPIPLTCLEEELADIAIRVFDDARHLNVDIVRALAIKHEYNKTRAFRHGGKKS